MSDHARSAGRQVRREEAGKTIIIERVRTALRDKQMVDLQRKEIALYAHVTPALISYYFPDRSSLFKAAAQPIIDEYIAGLHQILDTSAELLSKLRSLVALYITFNHKEGHLVDFYLNHCKNIGDTEGFEQLSLANEKIIVFFDQLLQMEVLRGETASTLQAMLWSMCNNVAQTSREMLVEIDDELIASKADAVYDCFVNGSAGLLVTQIISDAA